MILLWRKLFSVSLLLFVLGFSNSQDEKGILIVKINGFESSIGKARILVFKTGMEEFYPMSSEKAFKRITVPIIERKVVYKFKDIPYGDYAVSVHHDEDNNGEVNTNWLGIPNEGFGASNDAKGNFGPPTFEDAKITLSSTQKIIVINMVN